MKILQINCVYPLGSTGKIVNDIHCELIDRGYESIVCYGRGKKVGGENIYKVCSEPYSKFNNLLSRFTGLMYGGCYFSTKKAIEIIKKEKPDVVHVHCINGYFLNIYKFISWLKEANIKTVLTLHAEFMYTANCGHALDCEKWLTGCGDCPRLRQATKSLFLDGTNKSWTKMYNAFKGFERLNVVSVSPWLMNRAKQAPIMKDFKHSCILNGLDTNVFKSYDTKDLKAKLNLLDKKIIFHATPFFSADRNNIKGGHYIIQLAKMLKKDNVHIIIAGRYDKNIEPLENVTFLGKIDNQELLANYYSLADLFLLTSAKETFSMTTAESLCCGTPVVGFKAGAPEQIAIDKFSEFVEYGNVDELYNTIIKYLNKGKDKSIEDIAKEKYSKKNMTSEYIKIYEGK